MIRAHLNSTCLTPPPPTHTCTHVHTQMHTHTQGEYGKVVLYIQGRDNGGTAHGGLDTSQIHMVSIVVLPLPRIASITPTFGAFHGLQVIFMSYVCCSAILLHMLCVLFCNTRSYDMCAVLQYVMRYVVHMYYAICSNVMIYSFCLSCVSFQILPFMAALDGASSFL